MRGADDSAAVSNIGSCRFIPTCVGQISLQDSRLMSSPGSSPHAWGRYITVIVFSAREAVHPHMRGADSGSISCRFEKAAVHPHMRGADVLAS